MAPDLLAWVGLVAVGATVATIAGALGWFRTRCIAKPLASLGFVGLAHGAGALDTSHGRAMMAAFVLCWLGDVLLLPKGNKPAFLGGILSFMAGHVAFVVAFVLMGLDHRYGVAATLVLAVLASVVLGWLLPRLDKTMRLAIVAYVSAIVAMVSTSVGAWAAGASLLVPLGATAFFVSDITVARQRFVTADPRNGIVGLPLYYLGQVLLAQSLF